MKTFEDCLECGKIGIMTVERVIGHTVGGSAISEQEYHCDKCDSGWSVWLEQVAMSRTMKS